MYPNEISETWRLSSGGASENASRMRSRSSWGVRPEVSTMRSASPRRLYIISRSLRIPSTTRSAGAKGWR